MITFILGPMFSGKSTIGQAEMEKYCIAGKKCLYMRFGTHRGFEARTGDTVFKKYKEQIIVIDPNKNYSIPRDGYDFVFIDEAHLCPNLVELLNSFTYDMPVFVSALNSISDGTIWEQVSESLPMAENIIFRKAVCTECGNFNAIYSYYNGEKKDDVLIGNYEYRALCRKCFNKLYTGHKNW